MKNISIARIVSLIGILVLSTGLILNSFELISTRAFRIITLLGLVVEVSALFLTFRKNEF